MTGTYCTTSDVLCRPPIIITFILLSISLSLSLSLTLTHSLSSFDNLVTANKQVLVRAKNESAEIKIIRHFFCSRSAHLFIFGALVSALWTSSKQISPWKVDQIELNRSKMGASKVPEEFQFSVHFTDDLLRAFLVDFLVFHSHSQSHNYVKFISCQICY